eukprot:3874230-Pyramimonas_sp.AAC.1
MSGWTDLSGRGYFCSHDRGDQVAVVVVEGCRGSPQTRRCRVERAPVASGSACVFVPLGGPL